METGSGRLSRLLPLLPCRRTLIEVKDHFSIDIIESITTMECLFVSEEGLVNSYANTSALFNVKYL